MPTQLREGRVVFAQDLNASTLSTASPTESTTAPGGVAPTQGGRGGRVVIMARAQISLAPMSFQVHVYGWDRDTGYWAYINSLNGGSSITSSTVKGPNASTVVIVEGLVYANTSTPVYCENYERYTTRLVCSASSLHTVSTYIGIATE